MSTSKKEADAGTMTLHSIITPSRPVLDFRNEVEKLVIDVPFLLSLMADLL